MSNRNYARRLARRYLPAPPARGRDAQRTELDPVGVGLLGLTVICILVPFIEQRTWHSPLRPALFAVAGVLGSVLVKDLPQPLRTP